jgi:hypothetical protein
MKVGDRVRIKDDLDRDMYEAETGHRLEGEVTGTIVAKDSDLVPTEDGDTDLFIVMFDRPIRDKVGSDWEGMTETGAFLPGDLEIA